MVDAVQEVLSRTVDPNTPLEGQEFYELRIDDSGDIFRAGFIVIQKHAEWSEIDQQAMWNDIESERCVTYEHAQERYTARRLALTEKGFIDSDMDPLV
jgi:hypothetical protein